MLLVLVGACLDEAAPVEIAARHVKIVTVELSEPPTAIAYRDERAGTWRAPAQVTPRRFELAVSGPYRLTVICDEPEAATVRVHQLARTPEDGRSLALACNTNPSPYQIRGTIAQAARVSLGEARVFPDAGETFEIGAARGRQTLVAITDTAVAVRRNLVVKHDRTIAPIDVAREGAALVPTVFTASNLDGTETGATAVIFADIGGTSAFVFAGDPTAARVVPSSLLHPRDDQWVTLAIHDPISGRTVTRRYRTGDSTTFPLPLDRLGPVVFDDFAVTWSTLPAYENIELLFAAFSFETFVDVQHRLDLSPRFVDATGATGAALDLDVPGMRPEWLIDPDSEYQRFIEASRTLPNGDVVSSDISQLVDYSLPET